MRKPAFFICENKDVDQLRGNREADQRLCFRYMDSTIPLLSKSEISSPLPSSVVVQPGLCRTWSETRKTGFHTMRLICKNCCCFYLSLTVVAFKIFIDVMTISYSLLLYKLATIMILIFLTDWSRQTVQTPIRLLLEEQSDQGLHCLLFHLHLFNKIP